MCQYKDDDLKFDFKCGCGLKFESRKELIHNTNGECDAIILLPLIKELVEARKEISELKKKVDMYKQAMMQIACVAQRLKNESQ